MKLLLVCLVLVFIFGIMIDKVEQRVAGLYTRQFYSKRSIRLARAMRNKKSDF